MTDAPYAHQSPGFAVKLQVSIVRSAAAAVALLASACAAKPYFVDFENGSDAGGGGFPSDPWKHCPGDDGAQASARRAALSPGDTVYFRGGIVYKGQIAVQWRGASGAPVVYDGNSSGKWGWGKAVIDGGNTWSNGFVSTQRSVGGVIIRNFEIRAIRYTGVEWAGGAGIKIDNADHVTIADCFIHDVGYWNNDGSTVPAGSGISMVQPSNCLITGNEITRTGLAGVQLLGPQTTVVSRNNIHDYVTWGIDLTGDYRACSENDVCDNVVHDLFRYDKGFWKGAGDPPHSDFCFIRKGGGFHPVRNIVERNLFFNDFAFGEFGGTAMLFLSFADSTVIRDNVFINAHSYSAVFFGWTSTATGFYNNTVYCPRTGALRLSTGGNNDIRNNIFVAQSEGLTYDSASDEKNLTIDHNLYCVPDDGKAFVRVSPWEGWSFAAWRKRGYDLQSRLLASAASFKFVTLHGYPVHCDSMDLHVLSGSAASGAGSVIADFRDGKCGRERAAKGSWDIGAFAVATGAGDGHAVVTAPAPPKRKEQPLHHD